MNQPFLQTKNVPGQSVSGDPILVDKNIAQVAAVVTGGVKLRFEGEGDVRDMVYTKLTSYTSPAVDDRVLLLSVSGSYVVLGKIG